MPSDHFFLFGIYLSLTVVDFDFINLTCFLAQDKRGPFAHLPSFCLTYHEALSPCVGSSQYSNYSVQ